MRVCLHVYMSICLMYVCVVREHIPHAVHEQGAEFVQYALSDSIVSPPEYGAHWYKFSKLCDSLH
jgi:hypothetical protein